MSARLVPLSLSICSGLYGARGGGVRSSNCCYTLCVALHYHIYQCGFAWLVVTPAFRMKEGVGWPD